MTTEDRLTYIYAASKFDAEAFEGIEGPGRLDSASDRVLTVALDILVGVGDGEEVGGDVEGLGHGVRFGRFVLVTDSQGFISAGELPDEEQAVKFLSMLDGTCEPHVDNDGHEVTR